MFTLTVFAALLSSNGATAPSDPHASREVRDLLDYFRRIDGKATIAGQHNYQLPGNRDEWMEKANKLTGRYPGLWASDFGWDDPSIQSRQDVVNEAKREWEVGSLVSLSWHCVRPMDEDGKGTWQNSVQGSLTDAEWKELVTPGSALNRRWIGQIDMVARYLRQLRDAHVPVLWRPFHEMNGGWFWWGHRTGPEGAAALWRLMYDRYVNYHHLDNLIWVWSPGAPDLKWAAAYDGFYPGAMYVDVLAADIYHADFQPRYYEDLLRLAAGKPIAMGEVGELPSPEVLKAQPRWRWFTVWAEHLVTDNKPESLPVLYRASNVLTRDQVRRRSIRQAP